MRLWTTDLYASGATIRQEHDYPFASLDSLLVDAVVRYSNSVKVILTRKWNEKHHSPVATYGSLW